jgi:hypothetical protein
MTSTHRPDGSIVVGFTAGFTLALVACAGLLAERVSRGNVKVAVVAHVLLTVAVLAIAHTQGRVPRVAAQFVGAALGIVIAHSLVRASSLAALPWLSERPGQLVNDAVAVFAPLAVVWGSSRRPPNTVGLVATLLLVTAYRASAAMWHLDGVSFSYSVQDLVTGEFAGSAIGITTFRLLAPA